MTGQPIDDLPPIERAILDNWDPTGNMMNVAMIAERLWGPAQSREDILERNAILNLCILRLIRYGMLFGHEWFSLTDAGMDIVRPRPQQPEAIAEETP